MTNQYAAGALQAGVSTTVSSAAIQIVAANPNRIWIIIQNTDAANTARIGIAGVTATTGFQLKPGASITFSGVTLPMGAIFAIREAAADVTSILVQEITQ